MTILYDSQIFDMQKIGGISRYHYELMKNNKETNFSLSVKKSENIYLQKAPFISLENPNKKGIHLLRKTKTAARLLYAAINKHNVSEIPALQNEAYSIKVLKSQNFDIFHPTYYNPYFLKYLQDKPFILTIHDMIYEKFPEFYPVGGANIIQNKRTLIEKASHIITISNNTKNDIMEIYNIPENNISVIYHGSTLQSNYTSNWHLPFQKYFLYTGSRFGYKNFQFMIMSISQLLNKDHNLHLICTADNFTEDELTLFKEFGIDKQVHHYFVSDSDLFMLYHNAMAFIFPSYYEGFGIPILEAFEAECPVLLSNSSCFPEIAQDAALYFNPKDKNSILSTCLEIQNENIRKELIKKGKERLQNFSWEKATQDTIKLYKHFI